MKRRFVLPGLLVAATLAFSPAFVANAEAPGSSPANPIVLKAPSDAPEGAVKTGPTKDAGKCSSTTNWVHTIPGTEAGTRDESRYLRDVPGRDGKSHEEWAKEKRTREYHEAVREESYTKYKYERQVKDCKPTYKTEYEWEKHVKGTKQTRSGNGGGWEDAGDFDWRDYPNAGPTWDDKNGESGGHNSSWVDGNTKYKTTAYKYVKTGNSREVKTGEECTTKTEYSGWVRSRPSGNGWVKVEEKKVVTQEAKDAYYDEWSDWTVVKSGLLSEPNLPADTHVREYRATGPVTVVDEEATEGYTEYYVAGGEPTRNRDNASWVANSPGGSWAKFDERTVADGEATDPVGTYYTYNDGVKCVDKPEDKPSSEPTPDKPKVDEPEPKPSEPESDEPAPLTPEQDRALDQQYEDRIVGADEEGF